MTLFKNILTLSLFFILSETISQTIEVSKKSLQLYQEAQVYFKNNELTDALDHLYKALEKDPDFKEARMLTVKIYKKGGKTLDPLFEMKMYNHLNYLYEKDSVKNAELTLDLVKMIIEYPFVLRESLKDKTYHLTKINHLLTNYLSYVNPAPEKEFANYLLNECRNLQNCLTHPLNYRSENLGKMINSSHSEYFPASTADDSILLFTRRLIDQNGNLGDENFYSTSKKNKNRTPAQMITSLSTGMNEGASTLSPDGRTLIFSRCGSADSYGSCDLYISFKNGENWSNALNLGSEINTSFWESQPSLSPDGSLLYFSSDRTGGLGQEDIYVSRKDTLGKWTKPHNLGSNINTKGRDTDPFIHASNRSLFFTSDGWLGLGGFDIFKSDRINDSTWAKPSNMCFPLNTLNHEKGITVSADGTFGYYYGVYEEGNGYMDIYRYSMDEKMRPVPASYIKGVITDRNKKIISGANIRIIDLNHPHYIIQTKSDTINGTFLVTLTEGSDYAFYIEKDGYILKSHHYDYTKKGDFKSQNIKLELEKIEKGKNIVFNNLFFDFDSDVLMQKSIIELKEMLRFLKKYPKMKIEIQGHTDYVGTDEYNLNLSLKRSKSVYQWLNKNNIQTQRISYKGFGKKKPLFPNTTEKYRQMNRRTEFRIKDF